ncbi:MAG: hypothetical protein PHP30_05670 [Bacteroidales bacterium]|nr:hypothetical protein [Bacteroidales bacterium]
MKSIKYFIQNLFILLLILVIGCKKEPPIILPEISTTVITNITNTSATSGGTITNDGNSPIWSRGVCWSINENPTVLDNKTSDESGIGVFTTSITGLTPNTTYYVRAYARNSQGLNYGNEVCFTTKNFSPALSEMLNSLPNIISWEIANLQGLIERNPGVAVLIQEKIDMLKRPALYNEIIEGNFFAEDSVTSVNGRHIPIIAVFPLEIMRHDASQSVTWIKNALPILENFMKTQMRYNYERIWYGFIIGNKGGGGAAYMEDKYTYESRTTPNRLPYEAILYHELSHSYIGNESLNQFLEVYIYNIIHTGSTDIQLWTYLRQPYTAYKAGNTGVYALFDIYQLIGHDGMSEAYKELYSLNPMYGEPLSTECKQVFINQAPENQKNNVSAILEAAKL